MDLLKRIYKLVKFQIPADYVGHSNLLGLRHNRITDINRALHVLFDKLAMHLKSFKNNIPRIDYNPDLWVLGEIYDSRKYEDTMFWYNNFKNFYDLKSDMKLILNDQTYIEYNKK
mmetsp:Transcript_87543/g.189656  ORF Transcript_87543/g.189656 Transcript_87543/m.189656 type:complete len:115 (-) Transcript_87543:234-578(-)